MSEISLPKGILVKNGQSRQILLPIWISALLKSARNMWTVKIDESSERRADRMSVSDAISPTDKRLVIASVSEGMTTSG